METKYYCYIEPVTNRKFYSKLEVLRYVKLDCSTSITNVSEDDNPYEHQRLEDCSQGKVNEKPSWLPGGWTMVLTPPRSNLLSTKNQEVVNAEDINSTKLKNSPNQGTKVGKTFTSEQNEIILDEASGEKIEVVQETPNNLPPGWIKEIKIQFKANVIVRRDSYYTDPVSKYVFWSEKDALRYLKTGDIRRCRKKPKKRNELRWLEGETNPPPTTPRTDILKWSPQTKKRQPLLPDLPCRSSKRPVALESIEDSHQNHQGSKENDNVVEENESKVVEDVCSDPCIDLAYKTLTGSISMENDTPIKSILQEASTSILPKPGPSPTNNPPQVRKSQVP